MKIIISGIGGAMGKVLFDAIKNDGTAECVAGVDKFADKNAFNIPVYGSFNEIAVNADCIIDFSVHNAVYGYIPYAVKTKTPCVIATTGFSPDELALIDGAAKEIPILQSGNMSIGINLLVNLAQKAAEFLGSKADIEIIEMHHNKKTDAPSGTALMLANAIKNGESEFVYGREGITGKRKGNEIGIHAVRGGTIVGKHDVMFIMNNEIVTLSHEADSKAIFAQGAIKAASFLIGKPAGKYSMKDLF